MFARLREAIVFPFRGERREGPLVTGWVLVLANGLLPVVPLVPLAGYLLRVLCVSAQGHDIPPPFLEDFWALTRTGVGTLLVGTVYLLAPVTLLGLSVHGAATRGVTDLSVSAMFVILAGATATLVLSSVGVYLLPIGLLSYTTGDLRAAFAPDRLRSVGGDPQYFLGWVLGVVVITAGFVLALTITHLPVVGQLLASLVVAYAALVVARLWGRAMADTPAALDRGNSQSSK